MMMQRKRTLLWFLFQSFSSFDWLEENTEDMRLVNAKFHMAREKIRYKFCSVTLLSTKLLLTFHLKAFVDLSLPIETFAFATHEDLKSFSHLKWKLLLLPVAF
ncbi:unnamed protein product [Eruca vesicaria subsp. sativa]|uniref:Secreted protein n=1 Tax=Eruca vesicaria subsp. sativa TaxID=29727 RepID=A0ABC8IN64_ERUVS|nr:unnamed protein product [Eruca vesicaria subsp. sativa]